MPHPPKDLLVDKLLMSLPPKDLPRPLKDLLPHPPRDLLPHPPKDLRPHPPRDLLPHLPKDLLLPRYVTGHVVAGHHHLLSL